MTQHDLIHNDLLTTSSGCNLDCKPLLGIHVGNAWTNKPDAADTFMGQIVGKAPVVGEVIKVTPSPMKPPSPRTPHGWRVTVQLKLGN